MSELITATQLAQFSGVTKDDSDTLTSVYISAATDIINNYLGYDCREAERFYDEDEEDYVIPGTITLTCLRIATLLQLEEDQNLGVNSKSFGESGSRTFLNVVNFDKYLAVISRYRDTSSGLT